MAIGKLLTESQLSISENNIKLKRINDREENKDDTSLKKEKKTFSFHPLWIIRIIN